MAIRKAFGVTIEGKRTCIKCRDGNDARIVFFAEGQDIGYCEYCPDEDYLDVWAVIKQHLEKEYDCSFEISNGIAYVSTADGQVWEFTVPKIKR